MQSVEHKSNNRPPKRKLLPVGSLLVLLLSAMLLASCATATTATSNAAICSGWKPLTYSTKTDTPATVAQIRAHNLFGIRRGCWKAGQ